MALANMYANHLGGQGGGFEPQRVNNGQLIITGLDGAGGTKDDVLLLSLNSFPIPKRSMGVIELGFLNEKRKFAGNPTYDDLSVSFRDFVDRDTAKVLWLWNQLVHDPVTGKTGLAAVYKKQCFVKLVSPEASIERMYRLDGCWPSSMDPGEIDMNGEGEININLTLTIDKFYPIFAGISPG